MEKSELILDNLEFIDNYFEDMNLIQMTDSKLIISNSKFTNNFIQRKAIRIDKHFIRSQSILLENVTF